MQQTNAAFFARKAPWACIAALCLLATPGLSQARPASSERPFKNNMRLIAESAKAQDGQKLSDAFRSAKPDARADHFELAYALTKHMELLAAQLGAARAMELFDQVQKGIELPDPAELAKDAVAAGNNRALSREDVAVFELKNTSDMSPEAELSFYAEAYANRLDRIRCELVRKRAKIHGFDGKHDKAVEMLAKYLETPDLSKTTREMVEASLSLTKMVGTPAPELQADKTLGSFPGLAAWKGKVVVIDFYAHWCHPCLALTPGLVSMHEALHGKGLEILGVTGIYGFFGEEKNVAPEQEVTKLQGLIAEKGMKWPTIVGPKTNNDAYKVGGIPHVVVVDRQGVIRNVCLGFIPGQEELMRQQVERLLEEPVVLPLPAREVPAPRSKSPN